MVCVYSDKATHTMQGDCKVVVVCNNSSTETSVADLFCRQLVLSLSSLSHQDAVVLRRLRIGHTHLTHSYLLNRQDQPECSHCDCVLTVAHVLLECNHYNVVRQRYFNVSSLHEFFDTVNAQNKNILGFIRDIRLYRLL